MLHLPKTNQQMLRRRIITTLLKAKRSDGEIATTPLATMLRKVVKYRDINPLTTESSKRKQPC
jgi:hypothetical protein